MARSNSLTFRFYEKSSPELFAELMKTNDRSFLITSYIIAGRIAMQNLQPTTLSATPLPGIIGELETTKEGLILGVANDEDDFALEVAREQFK